MKKNSSQLSVGDLVIFNPVIGRFDWDEGKDIRGEGTGVVTKIVGIETNPNRALDFSNKPEIFNLGPVYYVECPSPSYSSYLAFEDELELVYIC